MVLINYRKLSYRISDIVVADIIKQETKKHQQQARQQQSQPSRLGSGFLFKTWSKTKGAKGQHGKEACSDSRDCDHQQGYQTGASPASTMAPAAMGDCSSSVTRKTGSSSSSPAPHTASTMGPAAAGGAGAAGAAAAAMPGSSATINGDNSSCRSGIVNATSDETTPPTQGMAAAAAGPHQPQVLSSSMMEKMLAAHSRDARRVEVMMPGPSVLFFGVVVSISWILINVTGTLLMLTFLLLGASSSFVIGG